MFSIFKKWSQVYFADEEAIGLLLIILVGLMTVLYFGHIMAPVLAALIISYLLLGLLNRLAQWMPDSLAFYFAYCLFIGICLSAILFVIPLIIKQFTALLVESPKIFSKLQEQVVAMQQQYPELLSEAQLDSMTQTVAQHVAEAGQGLLSLSLASLPNIFAIMVYGVLIPLLVFFFLRDRELILAWFAKLLPKNRPMMNAVWQEMNVQVANYVRGKAIEILFVGVASLVVFLMLGLNYAALLALGVGLSVIVPYVGAVAITIPVTLVAFWQFGITDQFWWVLIAYFVIQFIDGNVLVPLVFSEAVNMHPLAIILAVLFFGGVWGLWGVFFAIPLATLIKALLQAWPQGLDHKQEQAIADHAE